MPGSSFKLVAAEVGPLRGRRFLGSSYISHVLGHARLALALSVGFRGRFSEPPPWPQAPRARRGAVMKRAGRVCFLRPRALRARALAAFRLRPASRPLPSWSALRLRAARPRLWFVRASRRRPLCPRARVVKKEAEASRGSWSVVSSWRPCCGLLRRPQLVRAWLFGRVARGGPRRFFPEALAPGNDAPAAVPFAVAAVTGLAFLRSRNRARLCHARLLW